MWLVWILHEFYWIIHLFCYCVFQVYRVPETATVLISGGVKWTDLSEEEGEKLCDIYACLSLSSLVWPSSTLNLVIIIYRIQSQWKCYVALRYILLLKGIMFTTPNPSLKTALLKKSFQDNTIFIILWELMLDLFLTINGFPFFRFPFLRMFTICHDLCCHPLYLELDQSWVQNQLQFCAVIFSI